MWQQWVNVILGLWVIAIPFLNLIGDTLTWTLAITGIVIAGMALWGATEHSSTGMRSSERIQRTT
jgi:hypothetical protein